MKKTFYLRRRSLAFILAVFLLLSAMSPAVFAASFSIETIISFQYEEAKGFSDGLAAVKKGGKWGYIDKENNVVIPPVYDFAGNFSEGVAVVAKRAERAEMLDYFGSGEYTYYYDLYLLNKDGTETRLYTYHNQAEESFPLTYYSDADDIESASSLWFCQCGVINIWGDPYTSAGEQIRPDPWSSEAFLAYRENSDSLLPLGDDSYYVMLGVCSGGVIAMRARFYAAGPYMQCFFMDKTGQVTRIFDPVEVNEERGTASGLSAVYAPDQNRMVACWSSYECEQADYYETWTTTEYGYGALDMEGNWAVEPIYSGFRYFLSGRYFADGIWTVRNAVGKYGAVDNHGNVVIPFAYDFLSVSSEGMVTAQKDGSYGYIDVYNNTFTIASIDGSETAQIDAATHFSGGVAAVYSESADMAYCIQNIAVDGVLQAIPGTEDLEMSVYFPDYSPETGITGVIRAVESIMVVEHNDRYGYAELTFTLDLPDQSAMDSWAYNEVCKAIEAGLVPNELQNQYRSNITRADFALLMTEVATTITGKDLETLVYDVTGKTMDELSADAPFTAAYSDEILAANALGIILGDGNGNFDPYDTISRQQAATMLLRAATAIKADAMEGWGDKLSQANVTFSDGDAFAPYAREAIRVMASLDVMKGCGNNTFQPKGTYTRQQAFITAYRLMVQLLDEAE